MSKLILTEQSTAPGTPSAGKLAVYAKTDGKLYAKDDAGTEYDLTSAGTVSDLATALLGGNVTGGTDIVLTSGDELVGESEAAVAGGVVLRGGAATGAGPVAGGNIELRPGQAAGAADDGFVRIYSADGAWFLDVSIIGDEQVQFGTTLPMLYDGITGKLTVPGLLDPTGLILTEESDIPVSAGESGIFVSNGGAGRTAGHVYIKEPAGTYLDLTAGVAIPTLAEVLTAGHHATLSSGAITLTAGAAAPSSFISLLKSTGDGLAAFKHSNTAVFTVEGATGAAAVAGTSVELLGGTGGAGNMNGGGIRLRPGAKSGTGQDGNISLFDASGSNQVDAQVVGGGTYTAPVLVSRAGSFGVTQGPVVDLLDIYSPAALPDTHNIPNNAAAVLYNLNTGLGAGVRNVVLPAAPVVGQVVVVKDAVGGASGPSPINISAPGGKTIDGAASVSLSTAWKALTFIYNQNWFII